MVGATGAVGEQMREVLEERQFPVGEMRLLASERSAGQFLPFQGRQLRVQVLNEDSFKEIDIGLFSAGGSVSAKFAPLAVAAGAVVVDNTRYVSDGARHPLGRARSERQGDCATTKIAGLSPIPIARPSKWSLRLNRFTMPRASSGWWCRLISRCRARGARRWRN